MVKTSKKKPTYTDRYTDRESVLSLFSVGGGKFIPDIRFLGAWLRRGSASDTMPWTRYVAKRNAPITANKPPDRTASWA